ncbi:DUF2934 domain-containing protein [Proteiniphilum sp. X52]|nr:DUF2934 domain-containing protein [Proteiniphilum sp. X52]
MKSEKGKEGREERDWDNAEKENLC